MLDPKFYLKEAHFFKFRKTKLYVCSSKGNFGLLVILYDDLWMESESGGCCTNILICIGHVFYM